MLPDLMDEKAVVRREKDKIRTRIRRAKLRALGLPINNCTPEHNREMVKKYVEAHPWIIAYHGARRRCQPNGEYAKKGIKFQMVIGDTSTYGNG